MRLILLIPLVFAGCAQNVVIPKKAARDAVARNYVGAVVELRMSSYYGDLYEENELWLLSPVPVGDLQVLEDIDGTPIRTTDERGIIPAGTRFVVEAIEFPHPLTFPKRMLTSPRYNPWVILRPVDDLGLAEDRQFVALLPMDLREQKVFEREMTRLFGMDGEVRQWLASLRPTEQAAIRHKTVLPGMSAEAATAALGTTQIHR